MTRQSSWSRVPRSVRDRIRKSVFARAGGECEIRGAGCTGKAEHLDHIVPRSVDPDRILDPKNWRAACAVCNGSRSRGTAPPSRQW